MDDVSTPHGREVTAAHPLSPVVGLLVMGLALGLIVLNARPPAPKPATAPDDEFAAGRAMAVVERLLGEGVPHPTGSAANAEVRARIVDELTALGYAVETEAAFACRSEWAVCGSVTNIVTRLPGQVDGPAVMLTAHYDSVAAGPGAGDDMAGVAVVLEVARILSQEPAPRNPVIFLISDGEEPGLLGAEAFAAAHPWMDDVGVVVNLEANGTHGQSLLFETSEDDAWLVDAFVTAAQRPVTSSVFDEIYAVLPFNSDLTVYKVAGLAGINFAFIEEHPHYHTPLDSPENLDPGSVQHQGDNALAAVRAVASRDLEDVPAGNAVYQDIAPGVVLRWPEPWTVWLALVGVAVWVGVAAVAIRRGELEVKALLWGVPVLPVGVVGAALLGWVLGAAAISLTGSPTPWSVQPIPIRVAVGTGALLCLALVAVAVARRSGFRGIWLGVWLWWAVVSVVVATLAPGASILFLPPVILTGAAALVATLAARRSTWPWDVAAIVGVFGASWFWLVFTRGSDYSALGPDVGPTVGFVVGLAGSALAPLVAIPDQYGRERWRALAGAGLLMIAALALALRVPVATELRPERMNLLQVQDQQSGQAFWAIDDPALTDGTREVPASLREVAAFGLDPVSLLPWTSQRYVVARAPSVAAPGPVVSLLSDERIAGERVVRLQLHVAPRALGVWLYVPEWAGLLSAEVEGTELTIEGFPAEDGYQWFRCIGPECDGLTIALSLQRSFDTIPLYAVQIEPGLPAGGEELIAARPATAAPSGNGDVTMVIDRVDLTGGF